MAEDDASCQTFCAGMKLHRSVWPPDFVTKPQDLVNDQIVWWLTPMSGDFDDFQKSNTASTRRSRH